MSRARVARLTFDVAPATPHAVAQEGNRLVIRFEADLLDASLPSPSAPELIQNIRLEGNAAIAVDLGPRFATFKTSDLPGDRGGSRIVIDDRHHDRPALSQGSQRYHRRKSLRCWSSLRPPDCGPSSSMLATAGRKKARGGPADPSRSM